MSLDKFSMETVYDLILNVIEGVRGRYSKRSDKNTFRKYLNVFKETEKLYIENCINALTRTFLVIKI